MRRDDNRQQALLMMVHDVGKYIVRTARNLENPPAGPLPEPLLRMLIADLYYGKQGVRPSQRFTELRSQFEVQNPKLVQVGAWLAEIDALESAVCSQQSEAIRQVLALALEIDTVLRALLAEARQPPARRGRQRTP